MVPSEGPVLEMEVRANQLLSRLSEATLEWLLSLARVHDVAQGEVLYDPSVPQRRVHFPLGGLVGITSQGDAGAEDAPAERDVGGAAAPRAGRDWASPQTGGDRGRGVPGRGELHVLRGVQGASGGGVGRGKAAGLNCDASRRYPALDKEALRTSQRNSIRLPRRARRRSGGGTGRWQTRQGRGCLDDGETSRRARGGAVRGAGAIRGGCDGGNWGRAVARLFAACVFWRWRAFGMGGSGRSADTGRVADAPG